MMMPSYAPFVSIRTPNEICYLNSNYLIVSLEMLPLSDLWHLYRLSVYTIDWQFFKVQIYFLSIAIIFRWSRYHFVIIESLLILVKCFINSYRLTLLFYHLYSMASTSTYLLEFMPIFFFFERLEHERDGKVLYGNWKLQAVSINWKSCRFKL